MLGRYSDNSSNDAQFVFKVAVASFQLNAKDLTQRRKEAKMQRENNSTQRLKGTMTQSRTSVTQLRRVRVTIWKNIL